MARRAKNEGTIYKKTVIRGGKEYTYWEAQVTVGYDPGTGERLRKSYTAPTKAEVRTWMQETSLAVQKKEFFEPSNATLSEWIDIWLQDYCPKIKYQTRKHYISQCETHIKPALGAIPISELTTAQIQSFYTSLGKTGHTIKKKDPKTGRIITEQKPLAPKSIKNIHSILSRCLNTAARLKYIKFNPTSLTERPKIPKSKITPLSDEQVKIFLSSLENEKLSDLYKLVLFSGMRKSEALGLTWDSIDLSTGKIIIDKQLQRRPAKDGGYTIAPVKSDRIRDVIVSPYVISTLLHRKAEQDHDRESYQGIWSYIKDEHGKDVHLVFTKEDGTPINPKQAYLHYNKIAKSLGFDANRVHDLRHTFAVLSLENGDDYKTLQENLGHASASFTLDVYGHRSKRMQEESASRMQNFIDSIAPQKDKTDPSKNT